jgi:5'-3' exonuclease
MSDLTQKMQEVLVLQKENAFLSQTLATIHTDLDIRSDFSLPFSP